MTSSKRSALFYTAADDGLAQPWKGRVWLNPPYGHVIGQWMARARGEVAAGHAERVVGPDQRVLDAMASFTTPPQQQGVPEHCMPVSACVSEKSPRMRCSQRSTGGQGRPGLVTMEGS
ncbi:MAG TPA: hypothetical protein VMV07_08510 [Streptosporangiaceae bacterium]|nr:hypothetical protein [Streptosporangiaceae bacterium]